MTSNELMRDRLEAAPAADKFIATFRCESDGVVGYTDAPIHSVSVHDDGVVEVVIDHWPERPAAPTLAKHQPCGCVICTCEDEQQCQGCGAKHCGNRADHPPYVVQQPASPQRRPYNASGSLSEYGIFPECDAAQTPRACTCHPDDRPDGPCRERYAASECQVLTAQQPAAVDEAMVERACRHWYAQWDKADQASKMLWAEKMYDLLAAALVAQQQGQAVATNSAVAAIQFALKDPEGMTFLRLWNEGEFDTLRREWPDAPVEVYTNADPLAAQQGGTE